MALSFDRGYSTPAAVVVRSLAKTLARDTAVTFWIMCPGPRDRVHDLVTAACADVAGCEVVFLEVPDWILELPAQRYISSSAYGRLALPHLVDESVERLLYLDADTVVVGDLTPVATLDLGGRPLGAVVEPTDPFHWCRKGLDGGPWDFSYDTLYFNSGVLVMELPALRRLRFTEACVAYVQRWRSERQDQDAINAVMADRITPIPVVYNVETYFFRSPSRRERYAEMLRQAKVLHWAGSKKPWNTADIWCGEAWHGIRGELPDLGQDR
ncbi:glycosyltransferase family 8 protein [Actinokineospora guangxiensis]|uniref:Glycosyltransferase family 8 protein n=1 Tax=Actinokineospora guangxiensis TaxID=1490288 RepID=A0ABW0EM35_9PSEU